MPLWITCSSHEELCFSLDVAWIFVVTIARWTHSGPWIGSAAISSTSQHEDLCMYMSCEHDVTCIVEEMSLWYIWNEQIWTCPWFYSGCVGGFRSKLSVFLFSLWKSYTHMLAFTSSRRVHFLTWTVPSVLHLQIHDSFNISWIQNKWSGVEWSWCVVGLNETYYFHRLSHAQIQAIPSSSVLRISDAVPQAKGGGSKAQHFLRNSMFEFSLPMVSCIQYILVFQKYDRWTDPPGCFSVLVPQWPSEKLLSFFIYPVFSPHR